MKKFNFLLYSLTLVLACVQPYEPTTLSFESILVVEAILTDEYKNQEILLSRTFQFEADDVINERGADIWLEDDAGAEHSFVEKEAGRYVSEIEFAIQKDKNYKLFIRTGSGKLYSSEEAHLAGTSELDSLYATRIDDDFGNNGMAIWVSNSNSATVPVHYRYTYEETFKIMPPNWLPIDFKLIPTDEVINPLSVVATNGPESVILAPKEEEDRICYATNYSTRVILESTEGLNNNTLDGVMVHFIDSDNYILSHRYSVLVKQFLISFEAYSYYEILRDISSSESLFSENQPGFFQSNIKAMDDKEEKVLGFFELSSVSSKRIFFDYTDFYPGERIPPFVNDCRPIKPITLLETVRLDLVHYNDPGLSGGDPTAIAIPRECGDCTALGSNIVPDFWVD